MPKITKRLIDALPADGSRRLLWDSELKGFGLIVQTGGALAYVVQYRNAEGRQRRLTLGRHGPLTVEQARKLAQDVLFRVAKDEDPLADRRGKRTAPTMNDLFDRYLKEHVDIHNADSTRRTVLQALKNHLRPRLGTIKVNALTRADVARVHAAMKETPRHANCTLSVLSKALALAELWGYRREHSNPARGIRRYAETHRTRFLSGKEIQRLGSALVEAETVGLPWSVDETKPKAKHLAAPENRRTFLTWQVLAAIRLLLFTGARLSEILKLRWADVDFEAGTLCLPSQKGKQSKPHPIGGHVVKLLKTLPRIKGSPWVLPRDSDKARHITKEVTEHAWNRLKFRAGIEDARLHDLRHTIGTYAAQTGVNGFIVRDLLRHSSVTMTSRYANFDADPVRDVSNVIGERISLALEGNANVEK